MCNCGNKRNATPATNTQSSGMYTGNQQVKIPTQKTGPDIGFQYTGQSGLTVTGTVTGKKYRFNSPGEQQQVDYRDASAMALVPVLKRVG